MGTCIVTGGAGFVGSHLSEYLLGRGHRVICLDNLDTGTLENVEHIRDENYLFLNQDLTEFVEIDEPVDFVYHLASPASPIDYARLPLHTLKVGSYGTHHMLGLAKFKRARFLLASTSEVYGDPEIHPQPEDYWGNVNPIGPRGVYDEAKRYAEALTMAYHRQQGVDACIVRIFNTYGSRMRPHDGRAVPTFLRQALQDKPLTVFGDGSQTRSFCYVDDLVRGLVLLAESDAHLPVNIGNPDEYSLLQLAETVIEVAGSRSEITHQALPVDDPKVRQPDITRARQLLDWEPEVSLQDGLKRTIDEAGVESLVGQPSWDLTNSGVAPVAGGDYRASDASLAGDGLRTLLVSPLCPAAARHLGPRTVADLCARGDSLRRGHDQVAGREHVFFLARERDRAGWISGQWSARERHPHLGSDQDPRRCGSRRHQSPQRGRPSERDDLQLQQHRAGDTCDRHRRRHLRRTHHGGPHPAADRGGSEVGLADHPRKLEPGAGLLRAERRVRVVRALPFARRQPELHDHPLQPQLAADLGHDRGRRGRRRLR